MIKDLIEKFKQHTRLAVVALIIGFCLGKLYAYDEILKDCKVLGMTRFNNTPMGCHVGEKG